MGTRFEGRRAPRAWVRRWAGSAALLWCAGALAGAGCAAGGRDTSGRGDSGVAGDAARPPSDASLDGSAPRLDAGRPVDAGVAPDAPPGTDGGPAVDAGGGGGTDAGRDAGPSCRGDVDCNDGMMCTLDRCMGGACMHLPPDADGDGHLIASCPGGDDCNDVSSGIHPGATEVCDGLDNDCSGTADDGPGMECVLGGMGASCTTACGTAGTQSCNATCHLGPCYAATETCGNMCDDNGDGLIDEGCSGGPPNDTCTTGIDVTAGGSFSGTTCGADDTLALGVPSPPGCDTPVSPGTPDVFYLIHTRPSGSSYRLTITPGFAIQFVPSVCSGNGGCGPYRSTMDFTIGGGGGTIWYFAIERSGGGCGAFTLTVSGA